MTQARQHLTRNTSKNGSSSGFPGQERTYPRPRGEGLSDRQGMIAVMITNGSTCQDIAFELLLPLRTVQGHLYHALRILNVPRFEDLTFEAIAAHYAQNLATAAPHTDYPETTVTSTLSTPSTPSMPAVADRANEADRANAADSLDGDGDGVDVVGNSLMALDAAEESQVHCEDLARVAILTIELAAARLEVKHEREVVTQLEQAVSTRDTIGQAKGILMERDKISAAAAFAILSEESNTSNRKLVDVAAHLIYAGEIATGHVGLQTAH